MRCARSALKHLYEVSVVVLCPLPKLECANKVSWKPTLSNFMKSVVWFLFLYVKWRTHRHGEVNTCNFDDFLLCMCQKHTAVNRIG